MHRSFTVVLAALCALFLFTSMPAAAQDTTRPVINSVVVSPVMVSPGDMVHVKVNAGDNVGVTGVTAGLYALENTSSQVWEGDVPADLALGLHNINVTAADAAANSASDNTAQYKTVPVIGMRSDWALDPIVLPSTADHLFVMWGKATYRDANTFSITDGSGASTWVTSPDHGVCSGDFIVAKGILNSTAPPARLAANYYRVLQPAPRTEMNIANVNVGKDLEISVNGSLPQMVPYGTSLPVTITSSDSSKVLLAKSQTAPGSASIMLTVPAGSTNIPAFYVYGLADSGTVDVMATAPGCLGKTFQVTLAPSGFVISSPSSISTTSISANIDVNVKLARLNPTTHAYSSYQSLRGGISQNVNLGCSNKSVGTLTAYTLAFKGGDNTESVQFDPVGPGTSTISVIAPDGFSTPSNYQNITATVTAPDIIAADATVGRDLQASSLVYLEANPAQAVDMVVRVAEGSIATITADPNAEGTDSVTFTGVTSTSSKTLYIQGRALGTTTFTVEAAGYTPVTKNITVDPSGFVISSPTSISTTSLSANTAMQVRSARLNPTTLGYSAYQNLRAGRGNVEVQVTSSDASVGTITASPLTFAGNTGQLPTNFDPAGAGTTTVSVSTPEGFHTPSNYKQITATVTAPDAVASNVIVGRDLQASSTTNLQSVPPAPKDIIITVGDPSIATVSTSAAAEGSDSITLTGVNNTSSKTFYVQGRALGTTTFTVQADGYNTATKTITVDPSGFVIAAPTSINTTAFSANTAIQVRSARLRPDNLDYSAYQDPRPGIGNVEVQVTSSNTGVGTITTNPLVFAANIGSLPTSFDPVGAGTTTVSVSTPAGFYTPHNYRQFTATVRAPYINANNETVGRDLQKSSWVSLEVAPPDPVDLTVSVGDAGKATLSIDPLVEGSGSITFSGVNSTGSKTFYVQGRGLGTTTLMVSAPGYETVQKTITIDPAGFIINTPSTITTKVTSADTSIQITAARLNPTDFRWVSNQSLRGGLSVSVPVISSDPSVGTITGSPVAFGSNAGSGNAAFHPVAVGTTVVSVGVPAGFSKPNTYYQINAVVNP